MGEPVSRLFQSLLTRPLLRKLRYVAKTASPQGAVTTFYRFRSLWDILASLIGFSVEFRFLLDMYLHLNLYLSWEEFEYHPLDFTEVFEVPVEKVGKAKYGISRYDHSIYDPESVTSRSVEYLAWELTYKTTHHSEMDYRHVGKTLKDLINTFKDMLVGKGVRDLYVDALEEILSIVEGKALKTAYWGLGCWDVNPWMPEASPSSLFEIRHVVDWTTPLTMETIKPYENWWGVMRWDYARWDDVKVNITYDTEDYLDSKIKEFHDRIEPLWMGVFHTLKSDTMHHRGGYHQIGLGRQARRISTLLDRRGVPVIQKHAYMSFARELKYMYYEASRHYKTWRRIMSVDDLIAKYVRMGLDERLLREIASMIRLER